MSDGLLITAKMLNKHGACASHVRAFESMWPQGAYITSRRVRKAQRLGLNLDWFVGEFCNVSEYEYYRCCADWWRDKVAAALAALDIEWVPGFEGLRQSCADDVDGGARHQREFWKLARAHGEARATLCDDLYRKESQALFDAFMHVTRRFQPKHVRAEVERREAKRQAQQ